MRGIKQESGCAQARGASSGFSPCGIPPNDPIADKNGFVSSSNERMQNSSCFELAARNSVHKSNDAPRASHERAKWGKKWGWHYCVANRKAKTERYRWKMVVFAVLSEGVSGHFSLHNGNSQGIFADLTIFL
ncbi:hypothetical protein [Mesorhizobium sp. Root157]|uniref:hypothetical protein n=1 Tax=Mesorhizobium sp. Root157 TaxID=1736477 RepID=UPI0012E3BFD9|nr:hypothetical protein [Mesorhizobium sp. Root157]